MNTIFHIMLHMSHMPHNKYYLSSTNTWIDLDFSSFVFLTEIKIHNILAEINILNYLLCK